MSGQRRTSEEWQTLFAEFETGNESAATFCQAHGISSSNFYKRRSQHLERSSSAFVTARRAAPAVSPVTIQINDAIIRCDTRTPVNWVSDLVAALRG